MKQYIFYHGSINLPGVRNLEVLLTKAASEDSPDVTLCICSGGGDVGAGIGLYNFIRMLPVSVTTYTFGLCGSIAATVFLAGKKRIANPVSRFSLHAASYIEGPRKDEISESTSLISQPFKDTIGWTEERMNQYFGSAVEQFLTPDQAQEFKMVTEIKEIELKHEDQVIHVAIP